MNHFETALRAIEQLDYEEVVALRRKLIDFELKFEAEMNKQVESILKENMEERN